MVEMVQAKTTDRRKPASSHAILVGSCSHSPDGQQSSSGKKRRSGQSVMIGTAELSFALLFLLGLFLLHMAIRNPETVPGAGETMALPLRARKPWKPSQESLAGPVPLFGPSARQQQWSCSRSVFLLGPLFSVAGTRDHRCTSSACLY